MKFTEIGLRRRTCTLLALSGLLASTHSSATPLSVTAGADAGLIDAGLPVKVLGASPGASVVVTATFVDDRKTTWTSEATFNAGADGSVDVTQNAAIAGTYTGVSAHSMWCSALPVVRSKLDSYLSGLPTNPNAATLPSLGEGTVYAIKISAASGGDVATVDVSRTYRTAHVTQRILHEDDLRGHLYLPDRFPAGVPAVLLLAGSNGGLSDQQAMLFASRGYPALAIAYFNYEDLPKALANIPIETFSHAATWLTRNTGGRPVVIWGISRGSEGALLTASHYPDQFAGVIAIVPSPVANAAFGPGTRESDSAWTLGGIGVPTARFSADVAQRYMTAFQAEGKSAPGFVGTPYFLSMWTDAATEREDGIPVEKITAPTLLIAGSNDTIWPSWIGANEIRARMTQSKHAPSVEMHVYEGAGHLVANVGTGSALSSFALHPVVKAFVSMGGLPVENCESSFDAWERELSFLHDKVRTTGGPR